MPLSNSSKDRFVAPEMSKFTEATIRDMSNVDSQQEYWLLNYILSTMLRAEHEAPLRQQVYLFLRRTHAAFGEYSSARTATLGYLADHDQNLQYLEAIGHWEAFLSYSWQAYSSLDRGKHQLFKKGDGSVLERLLSLHNRAKHADEAIERGDFVEDSPLCVWLTNDGLRSIQTSLTFVEMAEILEDLASWASIFQDPATIAEKLVQVRVKDGE
jgi:hypothetical protein